MKPLLFPLMFCLLLAISPTAADSDLLIAEFEGKSYGDWEVEGTAFGSRPPRGTLPDQMQVTGYLGSGLVNSYYGGDDTKGLLTSPSFEIQRDYIKFLIGRGRNPHLTCINSVIDGKVVWTATGPNERLDWYHWEVKDLKGKNEILQIVDQKTGGWGHINVDHIVQSNVTRKSERSTSIGLNLDRVYGIVWPIAESQ